MEGSLCREPVGEAGWGGLWDGHLQSRLSPLLSSTAGTGWAPPAERFRETAVPQGPASALDSANETQKAAALLGLTFRVGRVKTVSQKQTLKRILDNEQCYQVNKQVRWGSLQRYCRTGDPGLRAQARMTEEKPACEAPGEELKAEGSACAKALRQGGKAGNGASSS